MRYCKSVRALMRVEFTSASVADMLTAINDSGIAIKDVIPINTLVVEATINSGDYQRLQKLLDRRGESVKIIRRQGLLWILDSVRKRPFLIVGIAMIMLITMFLPTRILFVNVEGNNTVSTKQITQAAEQVGIRFGASRKHVRSERIKNALLAQLPQLQWVGVNTYGCVAVICVEEETTDVKINENKISSIIASCDGIIKEITVTRGNALCKVGQAVTAGQVLVSGYTDCGIKIKATSANAEVYAETSHEIEAITPARWHGREYALKDKCRFYLIFGKNIIKLFKDSGISPAGCVKMYVENYLTLPGGFRLPIAVAKEQLIYFTEQPVFASNTTEYTWLDRQSNDYISAHMNAGKILDSESSMVLMGDVIYHYGKYACYEMIGRVRNEEIYKDNG